MRKRPLNIVEFIQDPDVLNDQTHSELQLIVLKSTYGLPLNEKELEIYERCTGRKYDGREQGELTLMAGRVSGKTTKVAAPMAIYEAFRDHGLPPGEEAHVMLLAPTIKQAGIAFRAIRKYLRNSRALSKRVVSTTKDEIRLDNGVTIGCYACTYDGVRGRTIIACICDEVGFWSDGETAANPAEEVIAAVLPGMLAVKNSKLVKISTPFRKQGLLWNEFQQRAELDFPVWQVSSQEMNPTLNSSRLERERHRSEEKFRREYMAEFTENIIAWIEPEVLDPCVIKGRKELPRVDDATYVAALDPALKHSDFALAVQHRIEGGLIVLDCAARWTGTKKAPLGFERVCREIADILERYRIDAAIGDQYHAVVISQEFLKLGITYKEFTITRNNRAQLFNNLKHLLIQRRIELLDEPELLRQLRSLEEHRCADGSIDIRPEGRKKDDLAVVLALGAFELSQSTENFPLGISFGRVPRPWDGVLPTRSCEERGGFPVGPEVCEKFPKCWDCGHCECYGF